MADEHRKQTIRVAYADFWRNFQPDSFFLTQILSRDFHLVEAPDNPELVICSVFGTHALTYDCPRLLYIGEAVSCDFTNYDYIIGFDHLSYPGRYLRIPLYLLHNSEMGTVPLTREKHTFPENFYAAKDRFCSYVVSAPDNTSGRDDFFRLLSSKKHVDSAGGHLNNMDGVRCENKIDFLRRYRFNIAFENTIMDGYVTEKITDAFAAGTIPIYHGSPSIEKDFDPGSFINVASFSSFEECADYVLYVDSHPEVYESIVRHPARSEWQTQDLSFEQEILDFFRSIADCPQILRHRYWLSTPPSPATFRDRLVTRATTWKQSVNPLKK